MAEPMNKVKSNESMSSMTSDTTTSTNPWGGHQPGPGYDSTGWSTSPDWEAKIGVMREHCQGGHCYIWLVLTIHQFIEMTLTDFTMHVKGIKESIGPHPVSKEMITSFVLYVMLHLKIEDTSLSFNTLSISLINHMMASKVRFFYSDDGSIFHVTPTSCFAFGCSCPDIYCEHGWAPRFLITLLSTAQKKVGATINFDDLIFDDDDNSSFVTANRMEPVNTKQPAQNQLGSEENVQKNKESTSDQWNRIKPKTLQPEPLRRMPTINEIDAYANLTKSIRQTADSREDISTFGGKEKSSARERLKSQIDRLVGELDSLNFPEELEPQDSSSNFGRRDRMAGKYLAPGTQLSGVHSILSDHGTQMIESQALIKSNNLTAQNPIVGFQKTARMIDTEQEAISNTGVVNGLARPLGNDRLLFLMHLHTAFNTIKVRFDDPEDLKEGLLKLLKAQPRTQSERLLATVLNSTFNMDNMEVIANGYNLPYIEIGMRVSSGQMAKCFTMLAMEYEILWFQEFKGLRVPDFHSRFYSVSERDPNTTTRVATRHRKPKSKPTRSKSGSILDYMRT